MSAYAPLHNICGTARRLRELLVAMEGVGSTQHWRSTRGGRAVPWC